MKQEFPLTIYTFFFQGVFQKIEVSLFLEMLEEAEAGFGLVSSFQP
ncbi:hypothetical protein ACMWAI_002373 [Enterococcus hirae]